MVQTGDPSSDVPSSSTSVMVLTGTDLPNVFLAPAVTVGETKGAMDSTSVFFLASSFAYNFVRK